MTTVQTSPCCPPPKPLAAIALLKDKDPGAFLIRDSHSFQGAYGLALKVATPPPSAQAWKGTECPRLMGEWSGRSCRGEGCGDTGDGERQETTSAAQRDSHQGRSWEPGTW